MFSYRSIPDANTKRSGFIITLHNAVITAGLFISAIASQTTRSLCWHFYFKYNQACWQYTGSIVWITIHPDYRFIHWYDLSGTVDLGRAFVGALAKEVTFHSKTRDSSPINHQHAWDKVMQRRSILSINLKDYPLTTNKYVLNTIYFTLLYKSLHFTTMDWDMPSPKLCSDMLPRSDCKQLTRSVKRLRTVNTHFIVSMEPSQELLRTNWFLSM